MPTVERPRDRRQPRPGRRHRARRDDAGDDHAGCSSGAAATASTWSSGTATCCWPIRTSTTGRGAAIGVYFDGVNLHQAIIAGCHISYCKHAGIKVERSEVRNLQITGCDIEYNYDVDQPRLGRRLDRRPRGNRPRGHDRLEHDPGQGKPARGQRPDRRRRTATTPAGAGLWTITGNILQDQEINVWLRHCRGVAADRQLVRIRLRAVDRPGRLPAHRHRREHLRPQPRLHGRSVDGIRDRASAGINLAEPHPRRLPRAASPEEGEPSRSRDSSEVLILGCQVLDPAHRGIALNSVSRCRVSECTIVDRRDPRGISRGDPGARGQRGPPTRNNLVGRGSEAKPCLSSPGRPWRPRTSSSGVRERSFVGLRLRSGAGGESMAIGLSCTCGKPLSRRRIRLGRRPSARIAATC